VNIGQLWESNKITVQQKKITAVGANWAYKPRIGGVIVGQLNNHHKRVR
jgi:hypothetical protein